MALPIAHATAGYLVHRATRRSLGGNRALNEEWGRAAVFMVVGNLPDLDFLVGFVLGRPSMFHRGVSHTVVAAVLFGLVAGCLAHQWWRQPFAPAALAFGAAYLSHLVLDFFTVDSRPPIGAPFLWPFSSAYLLSPVSIFKEIRIDGQTRAGFLGSLLAWPTIVLLAREIVIATIAIGGWRLIGWWRTRSDADRALVLSGREEDLA